MHESERGVAAAVSAAREVDERAKMASASIAATNKLSQRLSTLPIADSSASLDATYFSFHTRIGWAAILDSHLLRSPLRATVCYEDLARASRYAG